jgi:hypothetical protein
MKAHRKITTMPSAEDIFIGSAPREKIGLEFLPCFVTARRSAASYDLIYFMIYLDEREKEENGLFTGQIMH